MVYLCDNPDRPIHLMAAPIDGTINPKCPLSDLPDQIEPDRINDYDKGEPASEMMASAKRMFNHLFAEELERRMRYLKAKRNNWWTLDDVHSELLKPEDGK
jgi:hypothetical protein